MGISNEHWAIAISELGEMIDSAFSEGFRFRNDGFGFLILERVHDGVMYELRPRPVLRNWATKYSLSFVSPHDLEESLLEPINSNCAYSLLQVVKLMTSGKLKIS